MPARPVAPVRDRRPHRLALITLALVVTALVPGAATTSAGSPHRDDGPSREAQLAFMWGMAGQESGWDYFARNRSSGAFGKYQIMPFNWPAWAERYLGDPHADQSPANQERVAYGKLRDLHGWLGSWRRVAYWWLTGSSEPDERRWSPYARGYVDNIMTLRRRAPRGGGVPVRLASGGFLERGDWRRAEAALRLRRSPAGPPWRARGHLESGQVLAIRDSDHREGWLWLRVVTADGRLGWVKAVRTVPSREPGHQGRWSDVTDRGGRRHAHGDRDRGRQHRRGDGHAEQRHDDRSRARPRPH